MLVKGDYIRETYGIRDDDAQFPGPFTYKRVLQECSRQEILGRRPYTLCRFMYVGGEDIGHKQQNPSAVQSEAYCWSLGC